MTFRGLLLILRGIDDLQIRFDDDVAGIDVDLAMSSRRADMKNQREKRRIDYSASGSMSRAPPSWPLRYMPMMAAVINSGIAKSDRPMSTLESVLTMAAQ